MKKQAEAWIGFADKDILTVSEIIENPNLQILRLFIANRLLKNILRLLFWNMKNR